MDKFLSGFGLGGVFGGGPSSQMSSPVNPDLSTLSGGGGAKPDTPKKLSSPALPEGRLPSQPAQVCSQKFISQAQLRPDYNDTFWFWLECFTRNKHSKGQHIQRECLGFDIVLINF